MSIIPQLLTHLNPVWNYALPLIYEDVNILSLKEEPKQVTLDLFYLLRTFDAFVWSLMALFVVAY